jgi:hypothetical protein
LDTGEIDIYTPLDILIDTCTLIGIVDSMDTHVTGVMVDPADMAEFIVIYGKFKTNLKLILIIQV